MLYIFLVESGSMMTFDMNLALQTVANLKKAITSQCGIPEEKQVLLISGGETLSLTSRVCSYSSSGTDTSPIFLFSRNSIDNPNPPNCVTDYEPDVDMSDRVQSCVDMNPNYNTVVARAEMAQQLYDMAKQQLHNCERLVHDQHLQHQGWAAVVANLEDIVNSFSNTATQLEQLFNDFMEEKSFYNNLLENFHNDLKTLSSIPVLNNLITNRNSHENSNCVSLLDWISQNDSQSSLEQVYEYCIRGLEQYNSEKLSKLKEEVEEALSSSNNSNMKEVKGLEGRLYGLEKLMCEAKKFVDVQKDLAQAFYQNQTRASNLRDPSILPDLCASHQQQLQVMLQNHQKLRDLRRRCSRAKEELSENLHQRLRWIVFIEKKLSEIDSKVLMYKENLRRLKKHLQVVHQIHLAPKIYLASVVEVVRRKMFSDVFLHWATDLSQKSSALVENEIDLRQSFSSQLSSHFLQILFPGMNDFPPRFANDSPLPFDTELPDLQQSDIEFLRQQLPELSQQLFVPSTVPMPQPLTNDINKSQVKPKTSDSETEEFETVNEQQGVKTSNDDTQSNQKSTELKFKDVFTEMSVRSLDSEEFEAKINEYKTELEKKSQNFQQLEKNYEKIQNQLKSKNNNFKSLLNLSSDSLNALKDIKQYFNSQFIESKDHYICSLESIKSQLNEWISMKDKEMSEKISNCNQKIQELENQLKESLDSNQSLKSEINSLNEVIENLNENINSLNSDLNEKNSQINSLRDELCENKRQMTLEHELEITSLNEEMAQLNLSKQSLEESINQKVSQIDAMKQNYEKLESDLLLRFQEEKDSLRNALQVDFSDKIKSLREEFESKANELQENKEKALNELRLELDAQKAKSLAELKEHLEIEHKNELASLKHRFKLAISTTSIERTPSETSLEKVNLDLVDQLAQEREVQKLKQLILDEKDRYEELLAKVRKERDDEIKSVRSAIQAERQVSFNEALNKLSNEREILSNQLKSKQQLINTSISNITQIISKYKSQESEERTESLCNNILDQIDCELKNLNPNNSTELSEVECFCESQNIIKEKDSEINRLTKQLRDNEMTQSSSAIGRIERISVFGCEVGDIVLVYYEEMFDNYVVFHLNSILHFLHTECLAALGLKTGGSEARQRWTIAEVTDKEYCQARKAPNRYRVAVNTKFYRVKAKPWARFVSASNRLAESKPQLTSSAIFSRPMQRSASMTMSNMSASVSPIGDSFISPDSK